ILDVSVDTLRRWDKSGKLVAIRKEGGAHRYYRQSDLDVFLSDLVKLAYEWTINSAGFPSQFYCENSAVFQTKLIKMQDALIKDSAVGAILPLIVAVAGEIGNNSFDHNLGNWPDIPGIFFGYNINQRRIVLADRGLGILATLRRVRPDLKNHAEALRVAFTEIISGRAPEERGNGLKFVRRVVSENPIGLFFRTGDAELRLKKENNELFITRSAVVIRGCFAIIEF
ncbi:MAG: helix-turn-helix domain-containing protein, partial [Patescibacteria group bacterium]